MQVEGGKKGSSYAELWAVKNHILIQNSNEVWEGESEVDHGLLIVDPKRRRRDGLSLNVPEGKQPSVDDMMLENEEHELQNQKNEVMAGVAGDSKGKMEKVRRALHFDGLFAVDSQGMSGGLALLWRVKDQVNLQSFSRNHIDIEIKVDGKEVWRLTGIYGESDRSQRRKTWDLLRNLARDSNLPWCAIGDFKNIVSQQDKRGGAPYPTWIIEGFNEVLSETGLIDLDIVGHQFTWKKSRGKEKWTEVRLDMALTTSTWLNLSPLVKLYNMEGSSSDHSPIMLVLEDSSKVDRPKKFKFENVWLTEPICRQLILECWEDSNNVGIQAKIKACAVKLQKWGREVTGKFKTRIKGCKLEMKKLRNLRDATSVQKYKEAKDKLLLILEQKEIFWCQRSKQLWLYSGDKNKKYFHAAASSRRRNNQISRLKNGEGVWIEWEGGLAEHIIEFYKHLFTATQSNWHEDGILASHLNETSVVLIPTKKSPVSVNDLRPISLCNVVVKIITKVMANRMKYMLDCVVSECQSVFILGRAITDNIMVGYEMVHYLNRKRRGNSGCMALKIDMSKAYDRIEWDYLRELLRKMGFNDWWVHLVLQCVNLVSYTITHGFREMGPVVPSREGLPALLRKYEAQKWIHGIKVCRNAPSVSHLLFADDSYLFCNSSENEALRMGELLQIFEEASGQQVNLNKSSVIFSSNVDRDLRVKIGQILQVEEADGSVHYLGLPNRVGHNKSRVLGYLKDRMKQKVQSWKEKWISQAGREVLIKNVAQALPTYAMSMFLLPLDITEDFERSLSRFWWGIKENSSSGIFWMSWEKLSVHKDRGEIGFRNFHDFNLALLGKQGLEHETVASLVSINGQGWDADIIADLFNVRDQRCILNTQMGGDNEPDSLFWNEESTGDYTVRSAYRLIQRNKGMWSSRDNNKVWRTVWRTRAPPKVLNMVWRALAGCLPTRTILAAKRVHMPVICLVCNVEEETIFHVLVSCPFAFQCWSNRGTVCQSSSGMEFNVWLDRMFHMNNKEDHGEIVSLCWGIWKARNNVVWNQNKSEVNFVVYSTREYLAEWKSAQVFSTKTLYQDIENGDGATSWVKPKKDEVKRRQRGSDAGGAKLFDGVVRPEYADAIAVKEALSWVKEKGWRKIVINSDCLAVVQAMRSNVILNSPFGQVIRECRMILRDLNIELFFVKRSANMAAHYLARESCSFPGQVFDRGSVPIELNSILFVDLFE
ncbi:uncharacterized protein LOC141685753 [Apium graveolens]|uniref:uncharacterized protein LOC141685753 n=1 Tax=Apium graveolens TaxID=4045 RepID=UPI003D7A8E9B